MTIRSRLDIAGKGVELLDLLEWVEALVQQPRDKR